MDEFLREEVNEAFPIIHEMMETFDQWYPFEGDEDEDERRMARETFAHTTLMLEIGKYTYDDYDYLQWVQYKAIDNDIYYDAIGTFIYALSLEYGPI